VAPVVLVAERAVEVSHLQALQVLAQEVLAGLLAAVLEHPLQHWRWQAAVVVQELYPPPK
jgi:hypothetical protein